MERVVIIPALDPGEALRDVVERLRKQEVQIILVDDGSDEAYLPFFRELGEQCIVLRHSENRGKGEAIRTALHYIKTDLWGCRAIGVMDADGQHLPEDMERCLDEAEKNRGALVLGCRRVGPEMPWKSRLGNLLTRLLFRLLTGVSVSDTQTGLRAFSAELLDFMEQIPGERYEYEMNVLTACARERIRMVGLPIQTIYHDRENSCSHFRKVRDSVRIYRELFRFSAVSFSSFLLDYLLFFLFTHLLPGTAQGALTANVGARVLSAGFNYRMNCRLVFDRRESGRSAAGYAALAVLILTLNSLILRFLMEVCLVPVYPAKILTEITLFVISWSVQTLVIFKKPGDRGRLWKPGPESGGQI